MKRKPGYFSKYIFVDEDSNPMRHRQTEGGGGANGGRGCGTGRGTCKISSEVDKILITHKYRISYLVFVIKKPRVCWTE